MTHAHAVPVVLGDGAGEVPVELGGEAGEVLTGLGGGPPPLHAASANASRTSAMYPLPPRTTLVRLGFARALASRADLKDLRIRTLITSPPDVAAPRGFPANLPSRFLLVTSIRTQGMVTTSSRADVLSRYLSILCITQRGRGRMMTRCNRGPFLGRDDDRAGRAGRPCLSRDGASRMPGSFGPGRGNASRFPE